MVECRLGIILNVFVCNECTDAVYVVYKSKKSRALIRTGTVVVCNGYIQFEI